VIRVEQSAPQNELKLNDIVSMYFSQYGINFTVDHFIEIRQSYYDNKNTASDNDETSSQ